jgi:hypothetical protein
MNRARNWDRNLPLGGVKIEQDPSRHGESPPSDVRLLPYKVTGSGIT